MNKLGVYKNNQIVFKNHNNVALTITAIQDEHFHISIKSPEGEYACIMVPGEVWDEIAWRTLTKPKSSLVKEEEPEDEVQLPNIDISKLIPQLGVPGNAE